MGAAGTGGRLACSLLRHGPTTIDIAVDIGLFGLGG